MLSFDTGTAPAVGYTITLTAGQRADARCKRDWTTLQQQAWRATSTWSSRARVNGQVRGLSYRPFFDDYVVDFLPVSRPSFVYAFAGLIQRGDTLTVMGVPPREGIAPTMTTPEASEPGPRHRGPPRSEPGPLRRFLIRDR